MENFKKHPISTVLGLLIIIFAGVLLFVETKFKIPLYAMGLIALSGLMLIFAKDKFLDIITLGLSRVVVDTSNKIAKTVSPTVKPPKKGDD